MQEQQYMHLEREYINSFGEDIELLQHSTNINENINRRYFVLPVLISICRLEGKLTKASKELPKEIDSEYHRRFTPIQYQESHIHVRHFKFRYSRCYCHQRNDKTAGHPFGYRSNTRTNDVAQRYT
ncbi:hypothetical protein CHS0354_027638 [Potamilus streckersoni]|uniref:Uncharacterized protein n=1 Tax=Potamilus streckersoni TaxID=2493646 RepID=A0AAE0T0E0_9BIVA|nr:hypothetical protein CHS0354_027638 [Potamilus streckersoni]